MSARCWSTTLPSASSRSSSVQDGGADVGDVRGGRDRVHGLDVEGLLAVPAGRRRTPRCACSPSGSDLVQLAGCGRPRRRCCFA